MKILRIVVGILSLVAILAIGLQACSAANAAIDGTTPSTRGAAAFTAGLFLSVGYLLAGVTALAARKHNGGGVVAGCFFVLANLFAAPGKVAVTDVSIRVRLAPAANPSERTAIGQVLTAINQRALVLPCDPKRLPLRFELQPL